MEKKVKRKVRIKWGVLLIFVLCFSFFVFSVFYILKAPIHNIYVQGNHYLSDQEIIDLGKIEKYPSFLLTSAKSIESKILKSSYVISVSVQKRFWGQVLIGVVEARPLFIDLDGNLILSNHEVVKNRKNITVAKLVNQTPDVKLDALIQELSELNPSILEKISEIEYRPTEKDQDRFGLFMDDGNLAYVTLTKFSRMNYYLEVSEQVNCQRGIFNFDSGNHFTIKENIC